MISRAELFDKKMPYPLNKMVRDAFIYSNQEAGYSDDRIFHKLHEEDLETSTSCTMSFIIIAHIEWASTKEGHAFWQNIYDKLKQIEER